MPGGLGGHGVRLALERYGEPEQVRTWDPKALGPNGRHLCKWCRKEVPKRRKYWCSDECTSAVGIYYSPTSMRWAVEARDHGICAKCGRDCEKLKRVEQYTFERWKGYDRKDKSPKWWMNLVSKYPWVRRHTWEANHKKPVIEGGGMCGLDNMETLCIPCHRVETKILAQRRAKARKETK